MIIAFAMSNKKSREASESRYMKAIILMNKRQNKENNRIKQLKGDDYGYDRNNLQMRMWTKKDG